MNTKCSYCIDRFELCAAARTEDKECIAFKQDPYIKSNDKCVGCQNTIEPDTPFYSLSAYPCFICFKNNHYLKVVK